MADRRLPTALLLAAMLALTGCSDSGSTTITGTGAPPASVPSAVASTDAGMPASTGGSAQPSAGATGAVSGAGASGAGGSGSGGSGAGGTGSGGGARPKRCSADGQTTALVATGVSAAATATASALRQAAISCDTATLVARATADQTELSFGLETAAQAFAIPEPESRYLNLVRVLSTTPSVAGDEGMTIWPRVAAESGYEDPTAWQEVVAAGLITAEQSRRMQEEGSGYLGWRIGITAAGEWMFFIAGD